MQLKTAADYARYTPRFEEGRTAYLAQQPKTANPHRDGFDAEAWLNGWRKERTSERVRNTPIQRYTSTIRNGSFHFVKQGAPELSS